MSIAMVNLLNLLGMLVASVLAIEQVPKLEFQRQSESNKASVVLSGLSDDMAAILSKMDEKELERRLRVFVITKPQEKLDNNAQAILGTISQSKNQLTFKPRFGFAAGAHYRAIAELPDKNQSPIQFEFSIPKVEKRPSTRVAIIYPTADVLPENLLKFYVHFSAPMSTGEAYKHISLETSTGKIKAIANLGKQKDSIYTEDLNYGIGKATEPGSVFKLATLMSLLEDKYVDINSTVDCEGGQKMFYGLPIRDAHLGDHAVTIKEAFAKSSNVAFAKLADQYYHEQPSKFLDHLHQFRLDQMTGVDITASSGRPLIKSPKSRSWSKTTIPFMAHGYEELVTPLHMLMLYNAVANNGRMMRPYLVSSIREYGVEVRQVQPQVLVEKICSDQTLKQVKECMLEVVNNEHGTARKLKDSSYQIAGKTGTAVTALNNKGYNKGNKIYQASFIGYFPAEQPKYTIAVVIQNSKESRMVYGADVSGTVFKEISDRIYGSYISTRKYTAAAKSDSTLYHYWGAKNEFSSILSYLGMPFIDSVNTGYWRYLQVRNNAGTMKGKTDPVASSIPDVTGMGLKDAVYLLENMGLKVTATGRGKVINQSLSAGTNFNKTQTISLTLN